MNYYLQTEIRVSPVGEYILPGRHLASEGRQRSCLREVARRSL
jgi:hypothetical protein